MSFYLAEVNKKKYLLSASSTEEADKLLSAHLKFKNVKIQESKIPGVLKFKIGNIICSLIKSRDTIIYFTTPTDIAGKVDITLLPIEIDWT